MVIFSKMCAAPYMLALLQQPRQGCTKLTCFLSPIGRDWRKPRPRRVQVGKQLYRLFWRATGSGRKAKGAHLAFFLNAEPLRNHLADEGLEEGEINGYTQGSPQWRLVAAGYRLYGLLQSMSMGRTLEGIRVAST